MNTYDLMADNFLVLCLDSTGAAAIQTRLMYADWLEERGDPLGELIRLACAIRQSRVPGTLARFAELRPVCEQRHLDAIDAAWPKCRECDDGVVSYGRGISAKSSCLACDGSGRIGKLWRECPECCGYGMLGTPAYSVGGEIVGQGGVDCERCRGHGVLLEVECPHGCTGGRLPAPPPDPLPHDWSDEGLPFECAPCNGTGYIPSPLAPYADFLDLLFLTDEARTVRSGKWRMP